MVHWKIGRVRTNQPKFDLASFAIRVKDTFPVLLHVPEVVVEARQAKIKRQGRAAREKPARDCRSKLELILQSIGTASSQ
jgi:hypothetical protein